MVAWTTDHFRRSHANGGNGNGQDQRSHNRLNQITQRTVFGQGGAVNFIYDGQPGQSNGNLISDGARIYAWDALNRLIQVNRVSDGAIIAQYFYDAIGRRVRKITTNGGLTGDIPNETTDYFYFGNQCMEEREVGTGSGSGTESPVRQYVWGAYIDEYIQLTTLTYLGEQALPPGQYYLLQDTLYRAVALTNASGAIVEAYDTDAYGNTLIYSEPGSGGSWWGNDAVQAPYGANEILYCGYRYDAESQNYFVRARYYAAPLGRWLSRDPIGYAGGVNLYEYVGGSAAVGTDPLGKIVHVTIYASVEITAILGGSIAFGYASDDCGNSADFAAFSERIGVNIGVAAEKGIFAGCLADFLAKGITGVDISLAVPTPIPGVGAAGTGTLGVGGSGSGIQGGVGGGLKFGGSIGIDEVAPLGSPDLSHKCPCPKSCPAPHAPATPTGNDGMPPPGYSFPSGYGPPPVILPNGQNLGFW